MKSKFIDWWNSLAIHDEIERRMAILIQSLLLGLIAIFLFAILFNQLSTDITLQEKVSGVISNSIAILIFFSLFLLIRRGYYKTTIGILVFIISAMPSLVILVLSDLEQGSTVLILYTLSVTVAGLSLNRGALWLVYFLSSGFILLSAFIHSSQNPDSKVINVTIAGNFILLNGIISLFINQYSGVFKSALVSAQTTEALFRALVEQTSIVVYRDEPKSSAPAIYISPQIEKLLGFTPQEWLSTPIFWQTAIHSDDLQMVLDSIDHYIEKEINFSVEYRMLTKKGEIRWVRDESVIVKDVNGEMQYVHGVFIDITERKQAEEALRRNEQRLRQIIDLVPHFIFAKDLNGKFILANQAVAQVYGTTVENLLSKTDADFAKSEEEVQHFRTADLDVINSGKPKFILEESITDAYGHTRILSTSKIPFAFSGSNSPSILGVSVDITAHKQAEQALRQSEERFRVIFESSPIAICITTVEKGILLDANQAYWNISGFNPELALGKSAEELEVWININEREEFVHNLLREKSFAISDDSFVNAEKEVLRTNSFYELIRIGEQDCILSMFYDYTEQKNLEEEREKLIRQLELQNAETETLRESLASIIEIFQFEKIIEKILDQIKRVIPYDSASVWQIQDNTQTLIAGQNLPDLHATGGDAFLLDEGNSAMPILQGKVPYILNNNVQEELKDFQNEPHTFVNSWLAIPLKTRGKILGIIALDGKQKGQFTQHHAQLAVVFANQVAVALENSKLFDELQTELNIREKLIKELEDKNAELERFTYTVSHDLKSPLVTINGYLGYLEADVTNHNLARFQNDSKRIREAVIKMHSLLNDLLELSRIGRIANPSEQIPFEEIVQSALEIEHGNLAKSKITMIVQTNLPTVFGDRQRLVEVMQNLINNASKFMGNQKNPQIEIGASGEENGFPIFFVKDNGIGIPAKLQERIFGLFDKLDPETEGTGVGLAIVKRIVEVHGGRLKVSSEAGKGTTFYFTLPTSKNQIES